MGHGLIQIARKGRRKEVQKHQKLSLQIMAQQKQPIESFQEQFRILNSMHCFFEEVS